VTPNLALSAASKVKRHVLPLFLLMSIANYIDRMKIGIANTHRQNDPRIGAAANGLESGLFFHRLRAVRRAVECADGLGIASIIAAVAAFSANDRLTGRPGHAAEPHPMRAA